MSVSSVLRECHRLRKHLRDLQAEIDRGPRVLRAEQTKLAEADAAHKDAYEAIKKLKLKLKDDEGALKTVEAHLGKLYTRSMEVTTMKEMDATKHETETANGKKSMLEDAVLSGMSEIEERTNDLPNVEKRWAEAQQEFKQYQIDAAERMERLLVEQKQAGAKLIETDAQIPDEVKSPYERLVKKHGPDALAALVGRVCQSCRHSLTEQQRNDSLNGKFLTCPNCFRALYVLE